MIKIILTLACNREDKDPPPPPPPTTTTISLASSLYRPIHESGRSILLLLTGVVGAVSESVGITADT